ncbi:MAG: peptidoglycan DD-metalloendopeptidase family protein [Tannerellaceae bacterium]|jgi:murein DD-endopeptidase MepM/ murein hydrolase activator NlpD|nr:peptidoglycan DD-metalloendopeptidase family protein [Tannerellaceae bacterium]
MNIRLLLLTSFTTLLFSTTVVGQDDNKNADRTKLMDERVLELMADRVIKTDIATEKIATLEEIFLEEQEDLLFPADELYGSNWNDRWVDPFKTDNSNVTFPDSCEIDCSSFIIPIDSDLRVTSIYGPRRRRMHRGIDLKVQVGDTIRAAFSGKVRIRNFERRGYGNYLVVRHPNGLETVYGHLSGFLVDVNDIVRAGDPIALGGNTGRSTGSHLHFETRFLGQAIDPAEIIDFKNGVPHKDLYVFRNVKINGRNSNIYTSSTNQLAYHQVRSGDTLSSIARRYGTTVGELCRLNGLKSTSILRIGQSIRCSVASGVQPTVPNNVVTTVTQKTVTQKADGTPTYHRIESGDTLSSIAKKYGTTVSHLCELNNFTKTTILKLGISIRCS